ncbi:MAG: SHOCT domain-containing protein [Caldilineales bacterium]|nr:SHOCT domain-containing protein [Caldilineales bacterium]
MMGFGFGGIDFLIMLLLLLLTVGLAIWFVSVLFPRTDVRTGDSTRQSSRPQGESAVDILQRRYARGELTQSEYESMRRDLTDAV